MPNTEWDIDQYNQGYDYDDEGDHQQWGIQDLTQEAHKFEGIIVTLDGQRHDIPLGGGMIRTSSALNFGRWIDSCDPPEGRLAYIINEYVRPQITDNIYQSNVLLYRLMKANRKTSPEPKMPEGLLYERFIRNAY